MIKLQKTILYIVIFMMSSPVYSGDLGRLFISESERSKINIMRKKDLYEDRIKKATLKNEKNETVIVKSVSEKIVEPENNLVTMNGFIRRENGEVTVWINKSMDDKGLSENIHIYKQLDKKNQIVLKHKKEIKRLKVGQKWDYKTGKLFDAYETRE